VSLYDDDKHGFKDLIKVSCASQGCNGITKRFCVVCKKWFCKEHISNHNEHE
jgi:hypothetical protein